MNEDNIKVLELLASKICHDIISPVGAVSNGVELMQELGPDEGVIDLIAFSASQANAKLKTLRMAYGLGGADNNIKAEDVHKVFGEYIGGENRITQDWDPHTDIGIQPKTGLAKSLICCLILIGESLPKGGSINVEKDTDGTTLITGKGENARLREGYTEALNGKSLPNSLDPKLVHPYVTGLILKQYGFEISIDDDENDFIFLRLKSSNVF